MRAPRENGHVLFFPSPSAAAEIAATNQRRAATWQYDVQGRALCDLAAQCRSCLFRDALTYTRQYRDPIVVTPKDSARLLLTGHQSTLCHPGVWYKNFALGRLAKEQCATGINVVIDSDLARGVAIRVPTGTVQSPQSLAVPLDRPADPVAYEERSIRDPSIFKRFGTAVIDAMRLIVAEPLIKEYWPRAVARAEATDNLGAAVAQSRHQLEADLSNETLELPMSRICQQEVFAWFALHLLAQLPRFLEAHNSALIEYRTRHRMRNQAHPVPDLARVGDWLEAPFWVWSTADPSRRRLFVRRRGDELVLTDRSGWEAALSLSPDGAADRAVDQWLCLAREGIKIRTRALTTTLVLRMLASDLFLHGIGGAKYDEVTDAIVRRFFNLQPPAFAVVSATLRLPCTIPTGADDDIRRLKHQLRELTFHPERYVPTAVADCPRERAIAERIMVEKLRWIATPPRDDMARQRHQAINAANQSLQPLVAEIRAACRGQLEEATGRHRAIQILASREYAFCLFPVETLRELYERWPPPK